MTSKKKGSKAAKKTAKTSKTAKAPKKPKKPKGSGSGASGDGKLRVRMYRVGFGDFFLVSVPSANGPRHILIDCGVHLGDLKAISDGVADMAKETGGELSLIIVTHRHADHISGFAKCASQFRDFSVDTVWMSWWDDPSDSQAVAFQANLTALAAGMQARLALRAAADPRAAQALDMVRNITGEGFSAAGGGGSALAGNAAALAMLRGAGDPTYSFKTKPRTRYYKAGDAPELPQDLVNAGLVAQVLGPPTDPNLVAQMSNSVEQYLRLTEEGSQRRALRPFDDRWNAPGSRYPKSAFSPDTPEALRNLLVEVQPDTLLAAAAKADNTINNQSLVVHFTFGGRSLLFVGDAQWGNWERFLWGKQVTAPQTTKLLPDSLAILDGLDFYKVGHHGSTNATPIAAVDALGGNCVAMCSTEPGQYGSLQNNSEVPRGVLLDALRKKTKNRLVRSDQVPAGTQKSVLAPLSGALPANFSTPGKLYIDYTFP
jgi:beta-lactamase superfamily II metal-dependent hydrolase